MPNNFWKKELLDGSIELGTDSMILKKKASWTKGRQDIISVIITLNDKFIHLISSPSPNLSSWKQLDNYCFSTNRSSSLLLSREISCSINNNKYLKINYLHKGVKFELNKLDGVPIPKDASQIVCIIDINGRVKNIWR